MEVLLSAVASDIVGRLVSFLVSKFREAGSTDDDVVRLQRALLRARIVVEEAEARQVTNRAMLLQLSQLRREMCRGSYVLDAFTRRAIDPNRRSHAMASRSPTAGLLQRLENGRTRPSGHGQVVSAVLNTLEAALSDMKEFVVLLGACPRLNRQPYCTYLFMESCMFGRQMEKEQIISFLLQPAREDFDVLPIIGPHEVGKWTLVEHACLDDRVRDQFAKIHRLRSDDLDLKGHDDHQGMIDSASAAIFVIDLAGSEGGDEEEEKWRRFYSCMHRRAHRESKIIIISRMEAHSALGIVPALRLCAPSREELWYLFKALAFGSADPQERPELVRIAMALFDKVHGNLAPFAAASKYAAALRADLSARSWRRVLKVFTGAMELQLGAATEGPHRPADVETGYYFTSVLVKDAPSVPCLFYGRRKSTGKARSELPKTTIMEVLKGVVARGESKRFDVLTWQSRIPPYASYVATCEMEGGADVVGMKMKRRLNKRRRGELVNGLGRDGDDNGHGMQRMVAGTGAE